MKPLALASKSPRRKEILTNIGLKFDIVNSNYEEEFEDMNFSYEKIETLAKNKALGSLSNIKKPCYIISADTVVVIKNKILLKPIDKNDAFNMLKSLSNKEHKVVTSICILNSMTKNFVLNSTTTKVEFNLLSDEMIDFYIDNYKPFDKAGAYGIQELPDGYVKSITGDKENVIGLSSKSVRLAISELDKIEQAK